MITPIVILTEKLKKFIDLEEEDSLLGTIRYKKPKRDPEKEKGSRFLIAPNFASPACYDERPISADGRVAFHFKHTFVVKKPAASTGKQGKRRNARLAVTGDKDAAVSSKVSGHPADAAGYEAYISRPEAVMSITAQAYEEYMVDGNLDAGGVALFTNIDPDTEKREAFWAAVTRMERNPSHDVVIFHPNLLSAKDWRALGHEFDGTKEAQNAMLSIARDYELRSRSGDGCEWASLEIELDAREFTKLRKLLSDKQLLNRTKPAITIRRGRGGRVQRRMVGELPKGLDGPARMRIAQRFAGYLADNKMMYTVVVHAPDAYNHVDNYHLHAVAYDRPCVFLAEHGCWDFEYAVRDKYGRLRYPLRQPKVGELTRPSDKKRYREHGAKIVTEMRRVWEEYCNEELRKCGINRLFDHRSYKAMKIMQEPGRHLGTKAAALEAIGVATFVGIENAEKSYAGAFARIDQAHAACKRLRADCREEADELLQQAALRKAMLPGVHALETLIREMKDLDFELGDEERDLARHACWLKMVNSRAEDTIRRCQPILDAIEDGTAKPADVRCEEELRERVQAARRHLSGVHVEIAADLRQVAEISAVVSAKVSNIDLLMSNIRTLTDELGTQLSILPQVPLQEQSDDENRSAPPAHAPKQSRRSRQLQEYFEAPLDYEEEWNRVFDRIEYEDFEILPPDKNGPIYRVPGISKDDLDRLTHPFFKDRSQARLKAIYRIQELNKKRAERAYEQNVTPMVLPGKPSSDAQESDGERELRYAELTAVAERKAAEERAKAVADWLAELAKSKQALPVRIGTDGVELDIDAVPEHLRTFAELMEQHITPVMIERVKKLRHDVMAALGANPRAVQPTPKGFTYYLDRFPVELRVNVAPLLRDDPATRDYALKVARSTLRTTASQQAVASVAAQTPSPKPMAQPLVRAATPSKKMQPPTSASTPGSGLTAAELAKLKRDQGMGR